MKKLTGWVVVLLIAVADVQAQEIVVSWETNAVLMAEGMEPGTTGVVEAVSNSGGTFVNAASFFDVEYVADSNGIIQVAIPMFFRVRGTPASSVPEGMVLIPAGTNSGTDPDFGAYSLTVDSFYMDETEVTKAQWDEVYNWAVMNGYSFSNAGSGKGTDHPVQTVNWYDCAKWCNARSEMDGKAPCYTITGSTYKTGESTPDCDLEAVGYRLPTSEEWEYAARGGFSGKRFPWGDTITHSNANYYSYWSSGSPYYSYDESLTSDYHPDYDDGDLPFTSPTWDFVANGYGLYDLSGNVWEWCTDWYPGYEGSMRVFRGGSWEATARYSRSGYVSGGDSADKQNYIGFRTVQPAN